MYTVLATVFFVPSTADQQGEIVWKDFLQAMVATGFVPDKLYGSVWQFTSSKLDVERSIHFDEPHPSGKIPYLVARRHGRRLTNLDSPPTLPIQNLQQSLTHLTYLSKNHNPLLYPSIPTARTKTSLPEYRDSFPY